MGSPDIKSPACLAELVSAFFLEILKQVQDDKMVFRLTLPCHSELVSESILKVLKQVQDDNWEFRTTKLMVSLTLPMPNLFRHLFVFILPSLRRSSPLMSLHPSIRRPSSPMSRRIFLRRTPLLCHAALDAASRLKQSAYL